MVVPTHAHLVRDDGQLDHLQLCRERTFVPLTSPAREPGLLTHVPDIVMMTDNRVTTQLSTL